MDLRRRRDGLPVVNHESLISTINFVEIAIVNTVRSEGTMFSSRKDYPENAMLRPLRSIEGIMDSFMAHVERWADKAKLLDHYEAEINRVYKSDSLLDDSKFRKIRRHLNRIGEIDDFYCAIFCPLIDNLERVAEALDQLAIFLDAICSQEKRARPSSFLATVLNDSPSPVRALFGSISIDSPITTPSSLSFPSSIAAHPLTSRPKSNSLPSLQTSRPATISWKLKLSENYSMDSLNVSAAELEVFSTVLSAARRAKEAVEQAQKLCHERQILANDMQQVYEMWDERCLEWKESQEKNDGTGERSGYAASS